MTNNQAETHGWFWNENFWLSNEISWRDFQSTESKIYGQCYDLVVAIPLALALLGCRFIVENFVAKRIGKRLNVADIQYKKPPSDPELEAAYQLLPKHPTQSHLVSLSKQMDKSVRHIERWIRQRKKCGRPSELKKFCETFWRFTFYSSSTLFGIYVVHGEPYVWDTALFFKNYPQDHDLKYQYYIYYIVELAFYCSLFVSQFFDIRRKDFFEMFIHHIATIILLAGSYITNMTKIGAAIMIVHDLSDVFLEFSKMANYAKMKRTTELGFTGLAISFISTRIFIFPIRIIWSIYSKGMVIMKPFSGSLQVLFYALVLLQFLHFYWFSHLIRVAYSTFYLQNDGKDTRSESESSDIEQNGNSNHHHFSKK